MSWNKGFTKETHPSVLKISKTMRRKKIDNFRRWREKMKTLGKIPRNYPTFPPSQFLAEYIGVVLGDGNISKFPRTERILISANSNNPGFIKRYSVLTEIIFKKKPTINRVSNKNSTRISLYQKDISKRLCIPFGNRNNLNIKIPGWILKNKNYLIGLLRGLYEAEGSFCIHKPTYTYKFLFSNRNESLLENVYRALKTLGFHAHKSKDKIQISKKEEVYKIKNLLKFRQY
jgi:hypothetical protein